MNQYYKILGLTENAGIEEIKKAYRKKAKALHPDINKSENATENFILVNEAYEMLLEYKQWSLEKIARYWEHTEMIRKEKARRKAAYYARRSYKEFKKSKTYQSANIIFYFFDILFFLTGILIMITPIIFADFTNLELESAISTAILIVISVFFGFLLALVSLKSVLERLKFRK